MVIYKANKINFFLNCSLSKEAFQNIQASNQMGTQGVQQR